MRYVIVGAGIAGVTAAETLRKNDADAEVILIGEEHHRLYSRVLLPHYVEGRVERDRVFLKPAEWYGEQSIEWMVGERVTRIDPKNQFVVITDGREIPYDKLLITTGGDARTLPFSGREVSYFQTLDDADHLAQLISEQQDRKEKRAVVCGGGFIACEFLNIFSKHGYETQVVFRGPHFWSKVLSPELGEHLSRFFVSKGVALQSSDEVVEISGDTDLAWVKTREEKEFACDILGVGIGLERELGILRDAGLAVQSGLVVDASLRTSDPNIFAAGDIAEYYDPTLATHLLVGNYMNAMMQARFVAKVMAGSEEMFSLVSSYATDVLDLDIIFVGDIRKGNDVELVVRRQEEYLVQLHVRAGFLVGAVLMGGNTDRMLLTKVIQDRVSIPDIEKLSDPDIALNELFKKNG